VLKQERVSVSADTTLRWTLEKDVAVLEVTSEPAGQPVTIDGKATGQVTPTTLELAPGGHVVDVGDTRCVKPHRRKLALRRGQRETFAARPAVRLAGCR
jgi:hypothetical protein